MKSLLAICLVLSLGFMMTSCGETEEEFKSDDVKVLNTITFETISKDVMGNPIMITEETLVAVQSQEALDRLWNAPTALLERPSAPEIDFENYILLVAASGERPSSGYTIEIETVEELEDVIRVVVRNTEPGEGCMNLTVITTPHHIVKIERPSKNIVFNVSNRTNHCT